MDGKENNYSLDLRETKIKGNDDFVDNEIISRLKKIKTEVSLQQFENFMDLKKEISKLNHMIWSNINSLYKDNLCNLTLVHSFLIGEIIKIHGNEESDVNNGLIKENINVKHIISHVDDGKLSSKIYFFNDEDFEYYYVGDLHSDDFILDNILEKTDFFNKIVNNNKIRIIFLGDYLDRGKEHLKTIEKIMVLKYIFPGNVFLLRGNHDGGNIEENLVSLCVRKPQQDRDDDYFILHIDKISKENPSFSRHMIKKYLNLFKSMAIMSFAQFNGRVICGVHGGIPRPLRGEEEVYGYIKSLGQLTDNLNVNEKGETIISNILWSDPLEEDIDKYENTRRFGFKEAEFNIFTDILGIDFLIRGHQANEEGYKSFFNKRLYCIFGSGAVLKDGVNINLSTAYPWVKPKIIKIEKYNFINIIDLHGK